MGLAETAKMIAQLDLSGNFVKNLGSANKALGGFDSRLDRTQSHAYRVGQGIGNGIKAGAVLAAAGVGFIAANVVAGVRSLEELEKQTAQTNAVIKSTKGAAGESGAAITALSEKYESLNALVGDEVIRSSENMLLTFTNVRKQAFEPALQAILNMNTAMGKGPEGLTSTTIQVGKALNDPVKGLTALSRVGVSFDKTQQKRIKSLVKEGKLYDAQKIILAELNKEFGGSFVAQGTTNAAKVAKFQDAIDDLQRALAKALLPAIGNVADALSTFLADPQTVKDVENFGKELAKFLSPENIRAGIAALKSGFTTLKDIASTVAGVLGKAVEVFTSLPPEVKQLLVGGFVANKLTGGLITNLIGGAADFVFKKLGLMTVQAAVVNVNGGLKVPGVGGAPGIGGAAGAAGAVGAIGTGTALSLIGASIGASIVAAIDRHNTIVQPLQNQGLTRSEIVATLTTRDQATAQEVIKRSGIVPSAQDLSSAASKLEAAAKLLNLERPGDFGTSHPGKQQDDIQLAKDQIQAVQDLKGKVTDDLTLVKGAATQAGDDVKGQVFSTGNILYAGQYGAAAGIIGAIQRNRPNFDIVVNVSGTTVRATTTVNDRGGSPDSDRTGNTSLYGPGKRGD